MAMSTANGDAGAVEMGPGRCANEDGCRDVEIAAAAVGKVRGPEPYRNRYRVAGPRSFLQRVHFVYLQRYRRVVIRIGRWSIEQLLFGGSRGIVRPALRRAVSSFLTSDLTDLGRSFDRDLYVAQFRSAVRRKRAAVDPVLHYRLIGWREVRTPHASFDPVFYLHENPEIGRKSDPYLHYLRRSDRGISPTAPGQPRDDATSRGVQSPTGPGPVLIFNHGRGGGAVRYLERYAPFADEGRSSIRLRPIVGRASLVVWESVAGQTVFDLSQLQDWESLEDKARQAGVSRLLVNHIIDQEPAVLAHICRLASKLGIPYDVVLHDYYLFCPRVDGVTGNGRFCGLAPATACANCIADDYSELGNVDPAKWRNLTLRFMQQAAAVMIHSKDFAERVSTYLPGVNVVVEPLEADTGYPTETPPDLGPEEALRLATLGALNIPKGAAVVLDLAISLERYERIHLTVIGPTIVDTLLQREGVTVTGRYRDDALPALIRAHTPHAIFLPAIWPETWSYVLTEALKTGLPIIAFDVGAPAERLRRLKRGHLIPLDLAYRSDDLARTLEDLRRRWTRPA